MEGFAHLALFGGIACAFLLEDRELSILAFFGGIGIGFLLTSLGKEAKGSDPPA